MTELLSQIVFTLIGLWFAIDHKKIGEEVYNFNARHYESSNMSKERAIKVNSIIFLCFGICIVVSDILSFLGYVKYREGTPPSGIFEMVVIIFHLAVIVFCLYKIYKFFTRNYIANK